MYVELDFIFVSTCVNLVMNGSGASCSSLQPNFESKSGVTTVQQYVMDGGKMDKSDTWCRSNVLKPLAP